MLRYTIKRLFCVPPILAVSLRTGSQTGEFATAVKTKKVTTPDGLKCGTCPNGKPQIKQTKMRGQYSFSNDKQNKENCLRILVICTIRLILQI